MEEDRKMEVYNAPAKGKPIHRAGCCPNGNAVGVDQTEFCWNLLQ